LSSRPAPRLSACAVAIGLVLVHCGEKPGSPIESGPLDGAAARVGSVAISPSQVSWVAAAKGESVRQALDDLVADSLAAQGAVARGLDSDPAVAWARTTALARRIPARLASEAVEQGPPSDDELANVLVVQAVVMRSPTLREEEALSLAASIRQAVAQAHTADEFIKRANAVPHSNAKVVAQSVGPFAADGVDASGNELDADFVAAAFALKTPLESSPVVATPFGWHVLQLLERTRPSGTSEAAARRSSDFSAAVRNLRSRIRLAALLRELRSSRRVEIAVSADEMTARAAASP
jgi:hypothetical protein